MDLAKVMSKTLCKVSLGPLRDGKSADRNFPAVKAKECPCLDLFSGKNLLFSCKELSILAFRLLLQGNPSQWLCTARLLGLVISTQIEICSNRLPTVGWAFIRSMFPRGSLCPILLAPPCQIYIKIWRLSLAHPVSFPFIFHSLNSNKSPNSVSLSAFLRPYWHIWKLMRLEIADEGYLINCDIIFTKPVTARQ